ncbi:MAG: UbiA prenyltransferase family protein [Thermoanaerobaculaceae bacterium]|jgi:4-hydroxybenzoate polyprenyltransferase|nr:UbiA prenyltransferase family protein [Thermoanaerobaculaceae bacterium]
MGKHLAALLKAMRLRHWLKNGFVLAPAVFAGHAFDPPVLGQAAATALAFCLAASAGYLVNDILDRDADRADPVKRFRPIASGEMRVPAALLWACLLVAAALAITAAQGAPVLLALVAYLVITTAYSLLLKVVPILEALVLATGFLVRLVAGALAIQVAISYWLVICGFLLALLLAFGKRMPEAVHPSQRTPTYPLSFLHDVVTMLAGMTVVAYTLYTVSPDTTAKVGSRALLLTVPLVLFGILRYLLLLHREGAQDPTATLFSDRPLLVAVTAWAVAAGAVVHFGGAP